MSDRTLPPGYVFAGGAQNPVESVGEHQDHSSDGDEDDESATRKANTITSPIAWISAGLVQSCLGLWAVGGS